MPQKISGGGLKKNIVICQDHLGNEFLTQRLMCEHYEIKETTFCNRIRNGWNLEKALNKKPKVYAKRISLRQFCEENGLEIVLKQFDDAKNYPDTIDGISAKTDKKYYFTFDCPKHHSVLQRVADKTEKRSIGCPYCQNRGKVGRSIVDEYPDTYAKMFNEERNGIKASEIPVRSGKIYWWTCLTCGHEFKGKVAYVTIGKVVCQECSNKKQSDVEKILAYYLQKLDDSRIINFKIDKWKYDFYLPKYHLIIEYDGYPWHNFEIALKNDAIKDELAIKEGYRICRLRDKRLKNNLLLNADVWVFKYDYSYKFLEKLPLFLHEIIGDDALKLDINVVRDQKLIHVHYIEEGEKASLLSVNPEVMAYIDREDERNGNPAFVYTQSHKLLFYMLHPRYHKLKWTYSVHDLFEKKGDPVPQAIHMCVKVIDYYPELESEVVNIGMNMRENTLLHKKCDCCGKDILLRYTQLYYSRGNKKRCPNCLKTYRLGNLKKV